MNSDLNNKQREAAYAPDGPILVVAGAGSGKTKTLTARLAYLISQRQVPPQAILAITFTNKAAREMKERVEKLIASHGLKGEGDPFVGTFHSFGAWLLRHEAKRFSRTNAFSIFDSDDSQRLIKRLVADLPKSPYLLPASLARQFSRIKSEYIDAAAYVRSPHDETVWDLFTRYEAALKDNNAFDFDDLIHKPVWLLRNDAGAREKYQAMFRYILVDEYQDVNTAQYLLVKLLAASHGNVMVVGDDAQSIYKFRFSDFRNFLQFEREWPKALVIMLEQNYRSTKQIIESSSALIAHNEVQKKKNLWTENEIGSPVRVIEHRDEFSQADAILDEAQRMQKSGMRVGILYRTNAQSRALEQMCIEHQVPYQIFGTVSFYDRQEIKDIIAGVRMVCNPQDTLSFIRLEKNLGKRLAAAVREKLSGYTSETRPLDILRAFVTAADFMNRLDKKYDNASDRAENIQELMAFAQHFSDAASFLERVSLADTLDAQSLRSAQRHEGVPVINLMTIHVAKGLEFDGVLVAGVNEGTLPHQRSLFSPEDVEEERRLMYVAMTRARRELQLHFYSVASRFLYELPPQQVFFDRGELPDEDEQYIVYE